MRNNNAMLTSPFQQTHKQQRQRKKKIVQIIAALTEIIVGETERKEVQNKNYGNKRKA